VTLVLALVADRVVYALGRWSTPWVRADARAAKVKGAAA
jgi:osmoprotectant transport system permease protein